MPQFTLICTDEDSTVTTKEFEATVLDDVVDKTQDFLKGVGYVFEELRTQVYPIPEGNDYDIRLQRCRRLIYTVVYLFIQHSIQWARLSAWR